ncbi:hypothetical protein F4695_004346 [Rhizobium soli]|uniref:Uncharacterized protein n=1 Tax=Rhizobium soli TaxID=424798 RepID=A0A7X0JPX1_9HYPH|nr:hypothetical protein [Rhizobium soli]MBB6510954.1 hypothetical protein [Rhizobium soli]
MATRRTKLSTIAVTDRTTIGVEIASDTTAIMAARTTGMAGQAAPVAPAIGPVGQIVRAVGMGDLIVQVAGMADQIVQTDPVVPIDWTDQTVRIGQPGPTVQTDRKDRRGRIATTLEIGVVTGPTAVTT